MLCDAVLEVWAAHQLVQVDAVALVGDDVEEERLGITPPCPLPRRRRFFDTAKNELLRGRRWKTHCRNRRH